MSREYFSCLYGALIALVLIPYAHVANTQSLTFGDDNLSVLVKVNDRNIREATDRATPLIIDPTGNVDFEISYLVMSNDTIDVEGFEIAFVLLDQDAFSHYQRIDYHLLPGGEGSATQSLNLKDYGGDYLQFISGIYQLRYDVFYLIDDEKRKIVGDPFFVVIEGNPLVTVTGLVSTASVLMTGASLLGFAISLRNGIDAEIDRTIKDTYVSPTSKLMSMYRSKTANTVQNELSNGVFGFISRNTREGICPSCGTEWPDGQETCPKCYLTPEEAKALYSKSLIDKSLNASQELVNSVSGLKVSIIANKLGEGVPVTIDIVSLCTNTGLALVQPRVGKEWNEKTRKLVFSGLRMVVFSLFWIQACGVAVISLWMLLIALFTGTFVPIIIDRIIRNRISARATAFWKERTSARVCNL